MAAVLLGQPANARSDTLIWEGRDQSVRLAPQDEDAAPPNDHPANVAPQDIERMLADLRFRHADQDADMPPAAVFNSEQVKILGEAISTGLNRAEPSQDVTFSVIGAHRLSPGSFALRNRLTAGRAFFREGRLNVIFGDIQSPYRKKNVYGRIDQDFYPRNYGMRAATDERKAMLIASGAANPRDGPAGARGDWVVFDTGVLSESAEKPDADDEDIEQRLQTLKSLRDKDLISEEAYRKKVDEILDEL